MLISATTGAENFQSGSTKSYLFVVPTTQFPGKEVHIGIAAKSGKQVRAAGAPQIFPAAPGFREETGRWTSAAYEVAEGTVLKLFAQRTGVFGSMRIQASLLLRMRRDAAYRKVGTILTGHEKAMFNRVWVEGRFDILSLTEAERFGIHVPPHFQQSFSDAMVRRAFEVQIIDREVAVAPTEQVTTVENSQGEEVRIHTLRRNRALDL